MSASSSVNTLHLMTKVYSMIQRLTASNLDEGLGLHGFAQQTLLPRLHDVEWQSKVLLP